MLSVNFRLVCSILILQLAIQLAPVLTYQHRGHHEIRNEDEDSLAPIYLDSMEDLEHVAYLSLRNFNMTDEGLLQSSWLMGLGNTMVHKQHQKASASSALLAGASGGGESDQFSDKLALMLESFISHLRNGHLRRAQLDELEAEVANLNASQSVDGSESSSSPLDNQATSQSSAMAAPEEATSELPLNEIKQNENHQETESSKRCNCLVRIYEHELRRRHRNMLLDREARMEYETVGLNGQRGISSSEQMLDSSLTSSSAETSYKSLPITTQQEMRELLSASQSPPQTTQARAGGGGGDLLEINTPRLRRLCRLVVDCQSAEDFVRLLGGQWQSTSRKQPEAEGKQRQVAQMTTRPLPLSQRWASTGSELEQNGAEELGNLMATAAKDEYLISQQQQQQQEASSMSQQQKINRLGQTKSLRDSLSLSLAKLCPLILFQLHEEDGLCMVRRDDRPPMITVWGFATLFVTIVCFCSLIGLSITPLLGPTATANDESSSPSNSDETTSNEQSMAGYVNGDIRMSYLRNESPQDHSGSQEFNGASRSAQNQQSRQQDHRASLTLFEGLAVGSLVGSALFSLIPQAFELQERESNQGFLLKAFIIFMGIYLFFCSERLMRIILDTRHKHKKRKRLNHRSSNSLQMPSATGDASVFDSRNQNQQSSRSKRSMSPSIIASSISKSPTGQQVGLESTALVMADKKSRKSVTLAPRKLALAHQQVVPSIRVFPQSKAPASSSFIGNVTGNSASQQNAATAATSLRMRRSRRRKTRQQQLLAAKRRKQLRQQQRRRLDHQQPKRQTRLSLSSSSSSSTTTGSHSSHSSSSSSSSSSSISTSPMANRWGQQVAAHDMTDEEEQFGDYDLGGSSGDDDHRLQYGQDNPNNMCDLDSEDEYDFYNNNAVAEIQQVRAVNRKMTEYSKAKYGFQLGEQPPYGSPASFRFPPNNQRQSMATNYNYDQNTSYIRNRGNKRIGRRPAQAKQDISTVAWMIVLGDGLHNFIDGISIGAAFSESILSGVSISVAVICEEFPHELGDFAVLVSSGMTVRQALGYNFLSACTCYLGMAVGIILGDVNDGASYISALAAGVFLYIALVDMMGELSATLEDTSRESIAKTLKLLLLQNIGIFIGISIIFVLSFIDF